MRKILVRGPALSQSGYGEHTRSVLRALKSSKKNDIYLINVGWGETGWVYEDTDERRWIDSVILKTAQSLGEVEFDLSVQVQLPVEWQALAPVNIGVTAGVETDTLPESWNKASEAVDAIIVPSVHSRNGFSEELHNKISVVGYPCKKSATTDLNLGLGTKFNFLTVAQWSPRKNVEQLVSAFIQEFMNEEVGLVLKLGLKNGSEIDRYYTMERLKSFTSSIPSTVKCKLYLLHGHMSEAEMTSLYKQKGISAYATATHGEGYGLPIFDAVTAGLPVIAPDWGGISEFSKGANSETLITDVKYTVDNVKDYQAWSGVLETSAKWCFPDFTDLRAGLRSVYENTSEAQKNAKTLKTHITKTNSNKAINKAYNDIITNVLKNNKTTKGE